MRGVFHFRVLAIACALAGTWAHAEEPDLAAAPGAYTLSLATYAPTPGRVAGLLLRVRINGGPPLRLLLDTGAADVVIDQKAAQRSGLVPSTKLVMVCAGALSTKSMKAGLAQTVEIGPVSFRNYQVDVAQEKLGDGLDGVIPMSIFRGFLVRLDLPAKRLQLSPYPRAAMPPTDGFAAALPSQDLLFVPATMNRTGGYVLIDTGSAYTAVSRPAARAMGSRFTTHEELRAADGAATGQYISPGVRFQIAGREIKADPVLALDLSNISRFQNVEISGLLGYPELSSKILTVNYRDSLIRIEAAAR